MPRDLTDLDAVVYNVWVETPAGLQYAVLRCADPDEAIEKAKSLNARAAEGVTYFAVRTRSINSHIGG